MVRRHSLIFSKWRQAITHANWESYERQLDAEKNIYLLNPEVDSNFKKWRAALIYMLLEKASEELVEPEEVKEHTQKLMDRDNITKSYIEDRIIKSADPKKLLLLKDVYMDFVVFCNENNLDAAKETSLKAI